VEKIKISLKQLHGCLPHLLSKLIMHILLFLLKQLVVLEQFVNRS